ncbi:nuclear transport factor 2 family protein [Pseudoalteromonas sp. SSM20]|uniref:nuclear transport factor 2 family protein n=1 Tax=Pseudoalteromonas sp. SSM20 TaxID=3139394 RepID=UPI003BAB73FC
MTLTEQEKQTIAIVDKQLDAYNNRDIDAFAATYHDDVEIHAFPGGLQYQGKDELIKRYGAKFASLVYLNATSLSRIVNGNFLVDKERACSASNNPENLDNDVVVIASYQIENGLIKRVTFMRD